MVLNDDTLNLFGPFLQLRSGTELCFQLVLLLWGQALQLVVQALLEVSYFFLLLT